MFTRKKFLFGNVPVYGFRNVGDDLRRSFGRFCRVFDEDGDGIVLFVGQDDESGIVCADDFSVSVSVARTGLVADDCLSVFKRTRQTVFPCLARDERMLEKFVITVSGKPQCQKFLKQAGGGKGSGLVEIAVGQITVHVVFGHADGAAVDAETVYVSVGFFGGDQAVEQNVAGIVVTLLKRICQQPG